MGDQGRWRRPLLQVLASGATGECTFARQTRSTGHNLRVTGDGGKRTFIIATIAALSLLGIAASAQQPQSAAVAAGPHELSGAEINQLIYGRSLSGNTYQPPHTGFTWTFATNGQVTSKMDDGRGAVGTWQIVGNEVVMDFTSSTGRTINLPLKTDGAGRYFHAKSGVEFRVQ